VDYADFIRKLQLPTGFTVPTELAYEDLVARTITRDHLRDDVRGINASIELIQRKRGGRWPTGPVTEAGNFADLVWHEVEFRDGGSFTYRGLQQWLAERFPFEAPYCSNAEIPRA
jgi:hypothetical protein